MAVSFSRALVIGCPGSGKSTFARALARLCGVPVVHLDNLFWRADETTVAPEEFDARLHKALAADRWIMDGNYARTLRCRLARCDQVFFLDYPVEVCLEGIAARVGTKRLDIPWVERELDPEFFRYVRTFNQEVRPALLHTLAAFPQVPQTVFCTQAEANAYLCL